MCPLSTLLKDALKAEYLILFLNTLAGCFWVPQNVRFYFTLVKMNHIGRCSGDDSPCVGIVQSIEVYPWHSPHVLCHRNRPKSSFLYLAQCSE